MTQTEQDPQVAQRTSVSVRDHVATVALTRGDRHNALDEHMMRAIRGVLDRLQDDRQVRAVVLHGEGPSFCSGLDVMSFMGGQPGTMSVEDVLQREPGHESNWVQRVVTGWMDVPAPVVAALHGAVYGGGIQIALAADVRVCHPEARLSIMESRWGLVPDMGITRTLPRLVGIDRAKELTYSGRVIGAQEALELGLVTELADEPVARAHELAATWAERSPDAVQRAKRLFDDGWTMPRAEALQLEERLQRELLGSPNQLEAVRAGLLKQTPRFT